MYIYLIRPLLVFNRPNFTLLYPCASMHKRRNLVVGESLREIVLVVLTYHALVHLWNLLIGHRVLMINIGILPLGLLSPLIKLPISE